MDVFQKALELIDNGPAFAVALVLDAEGSTPRKAGVRAVIEETGRIWGTVGGGLVEAEAQRCASAACRSGIPVVLEIGLRGAATAAAEPICGGDVRLLIDPQAAGQRPFHARVAAACQARQPGVVLTTVRCGPVPAVDAEWLGAEAISASAPFPGADAIRRCLARESAELWTLPDDGVGGPVTQVLIEPVVPRPLLVIAGGGHIGQALARQAGLVGFEVAVVDDRREFVDPALYPDGVALHCGHIPERVAALVDAGADYIVIVTRGHGLDADTLRACIHKPLAYVGMIGSKRKVSVIRNDLIARGIATAAQFDRVFAPVGLDIGAVTVPEIAASISAELVAVRRKGLGPLSCGRAGRS